MKNNNWFVILCCICIGVVIGMTLDIVIAGFLPHKNCVRITVWDGKGPLGNPDFIKIVDNYISLESVKIPVPDGFYRSFEYNEIKRFCGPDELDEFCRELYTGKLGEVPETKTMAILQYSTGALLIVPIDIDNEKGVIRSQRAKSSRAWEIVDSIPRTKLDNSKLEF